LEIKKRTFWRSIRPEINAINHFPVNGPRCVNGLFTTIGLNCAASTHRPGRLYTSRERNRGKWTKIGAKRGETRPRSAWLPPAEALRSSPQEIPCRRPGMRFAHSASSQGHSARRGAVRRRHGITKHNDLSLEQSRLALRLAGTTRRAKASTRLSHLPGKLSQDTETIAQIADVALISETRGRPYRLGLASEISSP